MIKIIITSNLSLDEKFCIHLELIFINYALFGMKYERCIL